MRKLVGVALATVLSSALLIGARPSAAAIDVAISVDIAPPELPVYEQPDIPGPGYIWTPGYWAWADDGSGYYWVPGTWVLAPEAGYLWTPPWWGFENGVYLWHPGYWGTEIGFYGGVNYGYGYFGRGYDGGYWDRGQFRYNTAYTHMGRDVHITNVYNKVVINNITVNHVSFNGGRGGIDARPTEREISAEHARHLQPVSAQIQQRETAHGNPELRLSTNHGHPGIAATQRPGEFSGHGVVLAHGAPTVTHEEARRGPEINRTPVPPSVSHVPSAPLVHEQPVQSTPRSQPEFQRGPEVPHNVEPPRPPPQVVHTPLPEPQVMHTPPPQQHEQHPSAPPPHEQHPPPREGERRDEPHGGDAGR